MSIETSIIYTTSDGKQFDDRQEAETHEQWLADEPEAREADRQRGWTDYTPPQPEWKPEPKPATPYTKPAGTTEWRNHAHLENIIHGMCA